LWDISESIGCVHDGEPFRHTIVVVVLVTPQRSTSTRLAGGVVEGVDLCADRGVFVGDDALGDAAAVPGR